MTRLDRQTKHVRLLRAIMDNPTLTVRQLADRFGVSTGTVRQLARRLNIDLPTREDLVVRECPLDRQERARRKGRKSRWGNTGRF